MNILNKYNRMNIQQTNKINKMNDSHNTYIDLCGPHDHVNTLNNNKINQ